MHSTDTRIIVDASCNGILCTSKAQAWKTLKPVNGCSQSQTRSQHAPGTHQYFIADRPFCDISDGGIQTNTANSVSCWPTPFKLCLLLIYFLLQARFLAGNYKQAMENIDRLSAQLRSAKLALGIATDDVFEQWHRAEAEYLRTLKEAPARDSLAANYVSNLRKLAAQK